MRFVSQFVQTVRKRKTGDGYGLTNNQTGETEFTTASSLTTGFFATGTGYSFTAFLASKPDCSYDFNSTVVDCNVTAIELLSFEGEVTEAGNLISWTTATETNSSHFTVQRSIDGNNFRSIKETTAKGNNTIQDYKFLDSEATEGVYFYRLLETDKDGATNIVSSVIRLENKTTHFEVISVGPVPVSDYLNIDYVSNQTEEIQYEIYDITGQLLTSEMIQANEGENEIKINLSNYPAGTYFLKLNNAERQLNVSKFIRE